MFLSKKKACLSNRISLLSFQAVAVGLESTGYKLLSFAFDFYQIFGSISVLAIIRMKTDNQKNDKDSEVEDKFIRSIAQTISGGLNILLIWGLCYAAKYLFS